MPMVIINGKRVNMPSSSATGEDLMRAAGRNPSGRVLTKISASKNDRMTPGHSYTLRDGDKFAEGPDRVKASGDFSYFGHKEDWQKELITQQVVDVSQRMFKNSKVELDDDCNYVVFEGFLLPDEWQRANPGKTFVSMMIIFPDQYPELPTNGFYLPSYLNVPQNAAHFYERGYSGAFGSNSDEMEAMAAGGWKWYCTHIMPGSWRPARLHQISDWRKGDNLWNIITICKDVLTHPLDD